MTTQPFNVLTTGTLELGGAAVHVPLTLTLHFNDRNMIESVEWPTITQVNAGRSPSDRLGSMAQHSTIVVIKAYYQSKAKS